MTAAEEREMCFTGESEHQESTVVGWDEVHRRERPDTIPTILVTFTLHSTKKIAGKELLAGVG